MNLENNENNLNSMEENKITSFNSVEILKADTFSKSINKINVTNKDMFYEQQMKKKKNFTIAIILILIGIISIISGVFLKKSNVFYSKEGKRTIMIYMIGSDLESKYLAATNDINEIIDSNVDFDDNNIIIYMGGTKKWHTDEIDSNKHTLLEINRDGIEKIQEFDNNSMLDYKNLLYLLNYGHENYDTEYYDLILWDHGAGPIYGYGYDEYNKSSSMSVVDIKKAFEESPFTEKEKLEFIGFDACLMSSIEIANALSDFSEYMISSQEFEPGSGWDYSFLEKVNSNMTSLELGKLIIDYFDSYYSSKKYSKGYSLSLLKLSKIDNVINNTDLLFEKIDNNLEIDFSSVSRTRSDSKSFGRLKNEEYYYDLVDFSDLLDKLPTKYEKEISNLKGALNDLVIYQKTDLDNTYGVSLYFPYENKNNININMDKYQNLNYSKVYTNFLNDFSNTLTKEKMYDWNLENGLINIDNNSISIELSNDVINNYSSAEYIIFEKKDEYFIPIFTGSDFVVNDNKLTTKIEKKSIVVKYENEEFTTTAIESKDGLNYKSYLIPATVTRVNKDTFTIDVLGVYIEFVVDNENPEGFISAVYPIELNENLTYSKVQIDLNDWDSITLLNYKYNILDSEGNYTSNWINSEEVDAFTIDKFDNFAINFENIDVSKDYYCLLKVKDSQGYIYYSNIVNIR